MNHEINFGNTIGIQPYVMMLEIRARVNGQEVFFYYPCYIWFFIDFFDQNNPEAGYKCIATLKAYPGNCKLYFHPTDKELSRRSKLIDDSDEEFFLNGLTLPIPKEISEIRKDLFDSVEIFEQHGVIQYIEFCMILADKWSNYVHTDKRANFNFCGNA